MNMSSLCNPPFPFLCKISWPCWNLPIFPCVLLRSVDFVLCFCSVAKSPGVFGGVVAEEVTARNRCKMPHISIMFHQFLGEDNSSNNNSNNNNDLVYTADLCFGWQIMAWELKKCYLLKYTSLNWHSWLEDGPWMSRCKSYWTWGIFQPATFVYQESHTSIRCWTTNLSIWLHIWSIQQSRP